MIIYYHYLEGSHSINKPYESRVDIMDCGFFGSIGLGIIVSNDIARDSELQRELERLVG
jgi:hypothetical protein